MPAKDYIRSLVRGCRAQLMGKEPNLIPLSGLTLEGRHRKMAQDMLDGRLRIGNKDEEVLAYQNAWSQFLGVDRTWAVSSGRAALSALLEVFHVRQGDAVLVCGFTCIAVPNAVIFAGAEPVYYDIELNTYGPNLEDIRTKFNSSKNTIKGIIVQHTFGMIGDETEAVIQWAREEGLWVIEDACHAVGTKRQGHVSGTLGDAAFFSTERSKAISTFQGGLAVINQTELYEKMDEVWISWGFPEKSRVHHLLRQFIHTYDSQRDNGRWYKAAWSGWKNRDEYIPGNTTEELNQERPKHYAYKLAPELAKLGRDQIQHIDQFLEIRRQKAEEWAFWADSRGLPRPQIAKDHEPIFLRYPVRVEPENKMNRDWAWDLGIELGVWYSSHLHPSAIPVAHCPQADIAVTQCVNLPLNLAYKE